MPKMIIPTALRRYCQNLAVVDVEGSTVEEALRNLTTDHPELRHHLFDEAGKLRSFVNVFLGDENVRDLQKEATPVRGEDELLIIPAVAGGAPALLTPDELARYDRHIILPDVGVDGQTRLKNSSVLMVGTGGLGSPLGLYLAAAGVGRLGIVDFDVVDASNLQRQILHGTRDVGRPKIASARDRLEDINPFVKIEPHEVRLEASNALDILADYDLVVDGTDNFATRYLVNDACVLLGKPNVYGSIFRFEGQVSVFFPPEGPCYRCLYAEPPPPGLVPSCAEGGVFGVLPGVVGTLQATEIVKWLLGVGTSLLGRLLTFDALAMKFRELKVRRDPGCPLCGPNASIKELIDYEEFCGLNQKPAASPPEITPLELKARWDSGSRLIIIDVRQPHEWEIANLSEYGSRLIPLGELEGRLAELPQGADIVVHCKSGARSAKAQQQLLQAGFERVSNLSGGILRWADDVDPSLSKY